MSNSVGKDENLTKDGKPGIMSIVNLSDSEREVLLDYFDKVFPSMNASFIYVLLGKDNFLKFYDVLAGESIKIPSRSTIMARIEYIKIYIYVSERGFTSEAYERAAKIFGRRLKQVSRIIEKVKEILESEEDLDE